MKLRTLIIVMNLALVCIEARYLERKFDAYEQLASRTGYLEQMEEFDRLIDMLVDMRDIDFGIVDSWRNPKPTYKGCEPIKTGKKPVRC